MPGHCRRCQSGAGCQIKHIFTLTSEGVHVQKDKKEIPCFYWTSAACTQKDCKLKGKLIMEMLKGTGLLYRHLKTSNEPLWRKLQRRGMTKGRR